MYLVLQFLMLDKLNICKTYAFTLAEVLITLVIIVAVVVMTIPNVTVEKSQVIIRRNN